VELGLVEAFAESVESGHFASTSSVEYLDTELGSNVQFAAKGQASMIGLVLAIAMGMILLIIFLVLGLQGPPNVNTDTAALAAVGQMVSLAGSSFVQGDRLLDDTEYRVLRSNPALHLVAAKFRKDRRELALLWINVLLSDLRALWRFRRFLIQRGAPTNLGEEWVILRSLIAAMIFLNLLKLSVLALGPFAFARTAGHAYHPVDAMSRAAASVLGRIPSAGWPDLQRAWTGTGI
jgi:hypothetical protein